jgi:predicted RNase H-like nuclease (RuvC/YqgF family)
MKDLTERMEAFENCLDDSEYKKLENYIEQLEKENEGLRKVVDELNSFIMKSTRRL